MTGKRLFDWDTLGEYQLDEGTNLLYQMMNVTGERFSSVQLSQGQKTGDYFNENGAPKVSTVAHQINPMFRSFVIDAAPF